MKKQLSISLLFAVLMSMTGIKAYAHDFEALNADGKIIYYIYNSDGTTVSVSYRGNSIGAYTNEYSGAIVIPESVTNNAKTYSVTSIGPDAFRGCSGLTSVTIGNSVTSIGERTFSACSGLTSIIVESGNIVYDSRDNCNAIIETASNTLISGCKNTTIPNSVTSIGDYAFAYCSSLTSVTIPNSVTGIGNYAFLGCRGLTSITIPNSVTSIGYNAFEYCDGLTSISIPNSVTSIGSYAFRDCSGLTSVYINDIESWCKITFITVESNPLYYAHHLYMNGSEITQLVIPNSVTSIGNHTFSGSSGLTSVTIHNSVTSIGESAFNGCSGLTSITIPNSVTSIGYYAFFGCSGLASVIVEIDPPLAIPSDTFIGCYNATLYVPAGSKAKYETADNWKSFKDIVEMGPEKCATPTIKYVGGKLKFECETEGVEFISNFSTPAGVENNTSEVSVPTTYNVSVYAKKDGYLNSDVAKANIDVRGIQGDTNRDGEVTITDAVGVVNIILGNNEATAPALLEPQESEEPE